MKNDIDNLFREGTSKDFPYDEKLWNKVELELPTAKPKNKRFGFYFFSVVGLFISIIGSIFLFDDTNAETSSDLKLKENNVLKETLKTEEMNLSKEKESAKIANTKNSIYGSEEKMNSSVIVNNKSSSKTTKKFDSINQTKISEKINSSHLGNYLIERSINNKFESDLVETSNPSLISSGINSTNYSTAKKYEPAEYSILDEMKPYPAISISSNLAETNQKNPTDKLKSLQSIYSKRPIYIELEVNRSIGAKKIVSDLDNNIKEFKSNSESLSHSNQFGINFLSSYKVVQFGIGLSFAQYVEDVSYNLSNTSYFTDFNYDTSYTILNSNFNNNGTPIILIRQDINTTENITAELVDSILVLKNRFQRLQVPFFIGIEKSFGLFYTNLRTSLILNYMIKQEGGYISTDKSEFVSFSEDNQTNDFLLSNRTQLSFGYYINESFLIGTRLNYETDLTSFTTKYDSRFNQISGGIWIMWKPRKGLIF